MSKPAQRPLPMPAQWKDQGLDRTRPDQDITTRYVDSLGRHTIAIRYSRRALRTTTALLLVVIAAMVLLIGFLGTYLMNDPEARTFTNVVLLAGSALFFIWLLLHLGAYVISFLNTESSGDFIGLAPNGIYKKEPGWTAFYPWEEIFEVRPSPVPKQRIIVHPKDVDKVFVMSDQRRIRIPKITNKSPENREIFAGELAVVDVALPYWALKFYHENPDHRAELGTEAGLRRFQDADFPCERESER